MEKSLSEYVKILGFRAKDRITGIQGVVTSVSFDLYGCVQAVIHPGLDKDGAIRECNWFDVTRLEITSTEPVMQQPSFVTDKGPAEKPCRMV